jgi:hypothetical protein
MMMMTDCLLSRANNLKKKEKEKRKKKKEKRKKEKYFFSFILYFFVNITGCMNLFYSVKCMTPVSLSTNCISFHHNKLNAINSSPPLMDFEKQV